MVVPAEARRRIDGLNTFRGRLYRLPKVATRLAYPNSLNLFPPQPLALRDKLVQFSGLLGDPVGDPLLVPAAGDAGRLLDQLADIVAEDRDPIVQFGSRK